MFLSSTKLSYFIMIDFNTKLTLIIFMFIKKIEVWSRISTSYGFKGVQFSLLCKKIIEIISRCFKKNNKEEVEECCWSIIYWMKIKQKRKNLCFFFCFSSWKLNWKKNRMRRKENCFNETFSITFFAPSRLMYFLISKEKAFITFIHLYDFSKHIYEFIY